MISITQCAAPEAGEPVTVGSIWPDSEPVFRYNGNVYRMASTPASSGGYVTATNLATGQNEDIPTNAELVLAQSAHLIVAF
jgi:hypothetical protein